jgi:Na+-translocating ferredoxin:NAD+ oxidoreductase RnfC subunit
LCRVRGRVFRKARRYGQHSYKYCGEVPGVGALKTLKGHYPITRVPGDFIEINLGYKKRDLKEKAYYTMDRHMLKERVVRAHVYTDNEMARIEKEGCQTVIANSLCVSPFSGYRYYLSLKYASEILKGLKILMEAVASDNAQIIAPLNCEPVLNAFKSQAERSPNIYMRPVKDYYPMGMVEILHQRIEMLDGRGMYYPGKEGVLITPVEDLLKIYLYVEEPENVDYKPIMLFDRTDRLFVWVQRDMSLMKLMGVLELDCAQMIVVGDLLNGTSVREPEELKLDDISQVFIMDKYSIDCLRCIECGKCVQVCPVELKHTHSMIVLDEKMGMTPFKTALGCMGCGLCGYFCPGLSL